MSETIKPAITPNESDKTALVKRSNGHIVPMRITTVENADGGPEPYVYNADEKGVYESKYVSDPNILTEDAQANLARELSGLPLKGDRVVKRHIGGYQEGTVTHYTTIPGINGGTEKVAEFRDYAGNKSQMTIDSLSPDKQTALKTEINLPFKPNSWDETKLIRRSNGSIVEMRIGAARDPSGKAAKYAYNADEKGVFEHRPVKDLSVLSDEAQAGLRRELNGEITNEQITEVGQEVLDSAGIEEPIPDAEKAADVHGLAGVAQSMESEAPVDKVPTADEIAEMMSGEPTSIAEILALSPEDRRLRDENALVTYAICVKELARKPGDIPLEAIKQSSLRNMSEAVKKYADKYARLANAEKAA